MTRRINRSAMKRVRQAEKRRLRNKAMKTRIKNTIKKLLKAEGEERIRLLREAYSLLDKAARKGIIHENTAARKKQKLAKIVLGVGG